MMLLPTHDAAFYRSVCSCSSSHLLQAGPGAWSSQEKVNARLIGHRPNVPSGLGREEECTIIRTIHGAADIRSSCSEAEIAWWGIGGQVAFLSVCR